MNNHINRLRVFAGSNGSGKSTLYDYLLRTHSFTSYFHIHFPSVKIDEILTAKEAGYKTYLYVIATSDPLINIESVLNYVELGSHGVPEEKYF